MSYKRLDGYARKDGYALDIVLRPHTGDMVADALAHAKAAAVEARHILEYQETLTPEMERWLALLDALIEAGGNSPEVEYAPHSAAPTVQIEQKGPEFAHATLQGIRDFIETYGQQDALAALYGGDLSAVLSGDQEAETARLVHLACSLGYSAVWEVGPPVKLRIKAE